MKTLKQRAGELVAESVRLHPGVVTRVETCKEAMDGGLKEDVRVIWDSGMLLALQDFGV